MIAAGRHLYEISQYPCLGNGYQWSDHEFSSALREHVIARLFDDEGTKIFREIFTNFQETEFESNKLEEILSTPSGTEYWRIGESIAEVYLTDHKSCLFPWPSSRDIRKERSSLPGVDLVGIHRDSKGDCLVFGEVKTSHQNKYPPDVMYKMEKQLKNLYNPEGHVQLLRYLGVRAQGTEWHDRFQRAMYRYLKDNCDVQLFGFLVRDVDSNEADIRGCVTKLSLSCPDGMRVEIVTLYLPNNASENIEDTVVTLRRGDKV